VDYELPPEQAAQFGPHGPVPAAFEWLSAVVDGDLRRAWRTTHPLYRLLLTQAFVAANGQHPQVSSDDPSTLAAALAAQSPDHPLWDAYAETQLREFVAVLPEDFSFSDYGIASRPRPVSPDYELLLISRRVGPVDEPSPTEAKLLVGLDAGAWLVAGLNTEEIPNPLGFSFQ